MFYNKLGAYQVLISAVIGGAIVFIFNLFNPNSPSVMRLFLVSAGVSLLIIDWRYREKAKENAKYGYQQTFLRFLGPTDGGNLMFLPTWLIAVVTIIWGVIGEI